MFTNPLLAPTGRVKSFLENPDRGTLPASCTIFKLKNSSIENLTELFYFVQKALVTAAGVNAHLDGFDSDKWPKKVGSLYRADQLPAKQFEASKNAAHFWVQDSMDWDPQALAGDVSIMETSGQILQILLSGKDLYIDLSLIRSEGQLSSKGQISSGPESFWQIFKSVESLAKAQSIESLLTVLSTFNSVIRRGGIYKNGAVTTSLPIWNKHFLEYVQANPVEVHPWLKKGAVLGSDWVDFPEEIYYCLDEVNKGNLWLEKAIAAKDNVTWLDSKSALARLGHNVCREVLLESEATCILLPINYGKAEKPEDLISAYRDGMDSLCEFQAADHQSRAGIYLPSSEDRQVGLGLFGLANLLKIHGITYLEFTLEFKRQLNQLRNRGVNGISLKLQHFYNMGHRVAPIQNKASQWVSAVILGHSEAANVADSYGMVRAFAIAPTANISYRHVDTQGLSCTPEISPPLGQSVERLSQTVEELETFDYGAVEKASEVGVLVYLDLANCFQTLMDLTGLGHAISWNVWEEMTLDFLSMWAKSNLKSTYYRLDVDQSYLDKSDQVKTSCGLDGSGCG